MHPNTPVIPTPQLSQASMRETPNGYAISVPFDRALVNDMHFDHHVLACISNLNAYLQAHHILHEGLTVSGHYPRQFDGDSQPHQENPLFSEGGLDVQGNQWVLTLSRDTYADCGQQLRERLRDFSYADQNLSPCLDNSQATPAHTP